jgi:hypothetical protein
MTKLVMGKAEAGGLLAEGQPELHTEILSQKNREKVNIQILSVFYHNF